MWAGNHRVRRTLLAVALIAIVVVLFVYATTLAALVVLGAVGALLATAEMWFFSRYGRNPYDDEPSKPRSGPWEGPV